MNSRRMLMGIAAGALLGLLVNLFAEGAGWAAWLTTYVAQPIGQIFLRLLFMLVLPLVFSALVVGVAGLELRQLGRIGGKTLAYSVVVSFVAVVIGLVAVHVFQPGAGRGEAVRGLIAGGKPVAAAPASSALDLFVGMVPDNVVKAAASGDMIAVIVFALIFGVALAFTEGEASLRLREALQGLYDVMMTCIDFVLRLAPVGVGALVFGMTARLGGDLLRPLAAYVAVVLGALAFHMVVVYSLLLRAIAGRSPWQFWKGARPAMVTAFSTASSSATFSAVGKVAEDGLRLPPGVSRFVLTVGSTMNQNGTALFEGITVLFLAQLAGVDLTLAQQALVMAISVLAGIGTAGVPAGSLPVIAMILEMVNVPPEGLALILGVDRLLDGQRHRRSRRGGLRGWPAARGGARRRGALTAGAWCFPSTRAAAGPTRKEDFAMFDRWNDFERTFAAMDQLRRRMEEVFGGEREEADLHDGRPELGPAMALTDEGANLLLRAELPGVDEKNVEVSLAHDVLTVKGERRLVAPEAYSVHRQERRPYKFSRSFTLPVRVDAERISASMRDGVLAVTLPKVPESQPRQIAVKAS
jgi:dicarboxylate/amino acid:cation (Na+ or H+) symporter, DAACS family